jgi:GPH family glycoside/pentoside/hexuronide:cation symporter
MEQFKGIRRFLYNASTAGWALLDSIFLTFYVAFLLPPKEKTAEGMVAFISNDRFLGIFTASTWLWSLGCTFSPSPCT